MSTLTPHRARSRALKALLPLVAVLAIGAAAPGTAHAAAWDHTNPNPTCSANVRLVGEIPINGYFVRQYWSNICQTSWGLTNNKGFNTNTHFVQRNNGTTTKGDPYYVGGFGADWTSQLQDSTPFQTRACFTVFSTLCTGWW